MHRIDSKITQLIFVLVKTQ